MAPKIFINYRRDNSIGMAGQLHELLVQALGRNSVFMGIHDIPPGVDFLAYLSRQVAACDVMLVVIGPNWLTAKDEAGQRRLGQPDDFVAIALAAALTRNIRVIPVLVDGARMPKAGELPELSQSARAPPSRRGPPRSFRPGCRGAGHKNVGRRGERSTK